MRRTARLTLAMLGLITAVSLVGCAGATEASSTVKVEAQGAFTPAGPAKAGVPITLEFGPGGGCTAAIQFKELGIYEDLTDGGGTVTLPALPAGEYPLYCQSDMVMGVLKVQ